MEMETELGESLPLTELSDELSTNDILRLLPYFNFPSELTENFTDGIDFINMLKKSNMPDPFIFSQALKAIRPDLLETAKKIPWLASETPTELECVTKYISTWESNMQSFVQFLKTEVSSGVWKILLLTHRLGALEVSFEEAFHFCLERNIIKKDLVNLETVFQSMNMDELVSKLKQYMALFSGMTEWEFETYFIFEAQITKSDFTMMSQDICFLIRMNEELNCDNIKELSRQLKLPDWSFRNVTEGKEFLIKLKRWHRHDRYDFYQSLISIGKSDLAEMAAGVEWLAIAHQIERFELSMETFIRLLKIEIQRGGLFGECLMVANTEHYISFEANMKLIVREGLITKDLRGLIELSSAVGRTDLNEKFRKYQPLFTDFSEQNFINEFNKKVAVFGKEFSNWRNSLNDFIAHENSNVKQMLDDDPVKMESVYAEVTIVEGEPRPVNLDDETTFSDIAFLQKIANEQVDVSPVDLTGELMGHHPSIPEIWCLLGNPGSGKSFICRRTALQFCKDKQFSFLVTISCRDLEWHEMEMSRHKGYLTNEFFIQKWLLLSMPVDSSWTNDLCEYLVESDGEGLLIILDGMDEFVKKVPFNETILFLLLTRKALERSTIIVTSRPGAYTVNSNKYVLSIDRCFQVLGFSPENRDLYFLVQLPEIEQHKQLEELRHLHDEINHLSLVPVNASFFAALICRSDDITAHTLTSIYSELVAYLIRRQLYRMRLEYMSTRSIFSLHPSIQECLFNIGEQAYLRIYSHDLISSKDILLTVDKVEVSCQCLGLAEEHTRRDIFGEVTRVWSFAHLSLQEFVGAFWLYSCSSGDQCLSTRYIANSDELFLIFKMTFRFLCGLLSDSARDILCILYHYLPASPIPLKEMPMKYQLRYDYSSMDENTQMSEYMDWIKFTNTFVVISECFCESNSDSVSRSYSIVRQFLPNNIYFYISCDISPNEWKCFLQSLALLHSIQLIQIDTSYIDVHRFSCLLAQLSYSCSLALLTLKLEGVSKECYSMIRFYSEALTNSQLRTNTKVSLELNHCDLTDLGTDYSFNNVFQTFQNIYLHYTECSTPFMQQLCRFVSTDNLYYHPDPRSYSDSTNLSLVLQHINPPSLLRSLYLYEIPGECVELLQSTLPLLSNLREVGLYGREGVPCASLLAPISALSDLRYLGLRSGHKDPRYKGCFLQILDSNAHSLKSLELSEIGYIGLDSLDELLVPLLSCTNLVDIRLDNTVLQEDDVTLWGRVMNAMKSLVFLHLRDVVIPESTLLSLCTGLICHPTIRCMELQHCGLNSNSCTVLMHFIPTVKLLRKLDLSDNILSKPNPDPIQLLIQTALHYFPGFELTINDS